MLEILGRPNSLNVRKVLWLCAELNLPYTHAPWGHGALELQSAEFLALNPNGLVPVMRDGDFVLWESNTICRYLAQRAGRTDLLPGDARGRAEVERWMDWQATELNNAWRYAFMGLMRQHPAYRDAAAIATSVQAWNQHMGIVEAQLQRTEAYAVGRHFTLADIVLGLAAHRWLMTPMARPELPAVVAYVERLMGREGYRLHGRNGAP